MGSQVVLEHFRRKHRTGRVNSQLNAVSLIGLLGLKKQNALFYRPFGPFSREVNPGEPDVETIESLIAGGKWHEARRASARLIQTSLAGLRYLQT